MPNLQAAKKSLRQNERRYLRNLQAKRALKKTVKQFDGYVKSQNWEDARNFLPQLYKTLDKAVKKGILKENTASRTKSRLVKKIASK